MKRIPTLIILTLLLIAAGMSYVEFHLNLSGEELSGRTWTLWTFLYVVLVGTWVLHDKRSGDFDKPYDFGFFLYLFLPFILFYYLISTRGHEGVVTYIGFFAIYWLPEFAGLISYAYFY